MTDSIERIAGEMDEAAVAYAGHHSSGTFRRLATRLRALSTAGGDWVMVPREPTQEMRIAGESERLSRPTNMNPYHVWAAMLAASPQQEPGATINGNEIDSKSIADPSGQTLAGAGDLDLALDIAISGQEHAITARHAAEERLANAEAILHRVLHDLIAGSCVEDETQKALCAFLDPITFPIDIATSAGTTGDAEAAMAAIYNDFCAKDNGDVPLERYPQGAVDALASAGWAVVPCDLPFAVLGDAAQAGVFETGNPKHGWDYLVARTRIGPDARRALEAG